MSRKTNKQLNPLKIKKDSYYFDWQSGFTKVEFKTSPDFALTTIKSGDNEVSIPTISLCDLVFILREKAEGDQWVHTVQTTNVCPTTTL